MIKPHVNLKYGSRVFRSTRIQGMCELVWYFHANYRGKRKPKNQIKRLSPALGQVASACRAARNPWVATSSCFNSTHRRRWDEQLTTKVCPAQADYECRCECHCSNALFMQSTDLQQGELDRTTPENEE